MIFSLVHFSVVTSLVFTNRNTLVSSGRDKVIIVWDLNTFKPLRTIPVYDNVEGLVLVPYTFIYPYIKANFILFILIFLISDQENVFKHQMAIFGGGNGALRVINLDTHQEITEETVTTDPQID